MNITKLPTVTLKSVNYAAFASEETACFEAKVYLDGKPFCIASNDGHGGADNYDNIKGGPKGNMYFVVKELDTALEKLPDENVIDDMVDDDGKPWRSKWSFESLVAQALDTYLAQRDVARKLKRGPIFYDPTRKGCYTMKRGVTVDQTREYIKAKHPEYVLLNDLPLAKAVEYMTAGGAA